VNTRIGQSDRAHAPREQRDSELILEPLDLMTDGGRGDKKFLRGRLEAQPLRNDLRGLEKLVRRQVHRSKPLLMGRLSVAEFGCTSHTGIFAEDARRRASEISCGPDDGIETDVESSPSSPHSEG
jgi:hypothetical protein